MNVADLIKKLEKMPPDALVVMSCDSEGNGYSELRVVAGDQAFDASEARIGFVPGAEMPSGFGEEDVMHDGVPCVVFWP